MPRTEKRFGVVNQPASTAVEELVPSAATTRNVLINATARSAAVIAAAVYSGAFSNDANANVTVSPSATTINMSNASTLAASTVTGMHLFGKGTWSNVFAWNTGSTSGLLAVDQATGSSRYSTVSYTSHAGANYWRNVFDNQVAFKTANSGSSVDGPKLNNCYVAVSSTKAIGIAANQVTTATANSDMFDAVTISHTVGSSFTESSNNVGETTIQGLGDSGRHAAGAYALQDGVGYLLHSGVNQIYQNTSGRVGLGIYIYSNSSTAFQKRAFWNCDGVTNKASGYAIAYFVASDYNSTHGVFAFSQPSTTTLWSNISPTSSTSFPAGYALPADAAPAGFRIVSNSGTTEPDTNFLTGTITYPAAPTGVDVPLTVGVNYVSPVTSIKFSPDGGRVAVAYSRNYSGTGNTNSVVVVYTRQNDGTWTHTASSGSAIRYMPDSPDCMAWSPDGGYIAIAANTSTSNSDQIPATTSYHIDLWAVGGGSSVIDNSLITSWTLASSKYPDFAQYTSPKSGTASVNAVTINANTITGGSANNNYSIRCVAAFTTSTGLPGSVVATIDGVTLTSSHRSLQGYVMQAAGTVGTSGQPATNYVTSVITDLPLVAGQTSQVSNIVLGSGERLYVSSSTSNSVDISAHGVEST